jgi:hypothetical protein
LPAFGALPDTRFDRVEMSCPLTRGCKVIDLEDRRVERTQSFLPLPCPPPSTVE